MTGRGRREGEREIQTGRGFRDSVCCPHTPHRDFCHNSVCGMKQEGGRWDEDE